MMTLMWNHAPQMNALMNEPGSNWPNFTLQEMTDLYNFLKPAAREGNDEKH